MRPQTLREAIEQHKAGRDFGVALNEFLDEFYMTDSAKRQTMIEDEPPFIGDERLDAYVGAVGEHLVRRWKLDHIPEWSLAPERELEWPWFDSAFGDSIGDKLRMILLIESPIAFRRRQIFTEAEPLRRARMPRDARAIANERGMLSDEWVNPKL